MLIRKVNKEIVVNKPQRITQHVFLEMLKAYVQNAEYVFRNGKFSSHKESAKEIHLDAYNIFKYFKLSRNLFITIQDPILVLSFYYRNQYDRLIY